MSSPRQTTTDSSRSHKSSGLFGMQFLDLAEDVEPFSAGPIRSLHSMFPSLENQYHVLRVIGTGTFSSVFKAIDLKYNDLDNSAWDHSPRKRYNTRLSCNEPKLVAIKQIYASASPNRIHREIDILLEVRKTGCKQALSIITGLRHEDQILIVLPYVQHADFRDFFSEYPLREISAYMRDLILACEAMNQIGLIHRDIKPGNFCWNPNTRQGVLVDFGLAQWEEEIDETQTPCHCMHEEFPDGFYELSNIQHIKEHEMQTLGWCYFRTDRRPSKRAERGGTRGFRAPEVLFRCSTQTTGLDIWSCGIILLCFLTQRFPFFCSDDDTEALLELTNIFGVEEMTICAARHMCILDTQIPRLTMKRHSWHHLVNSLTAGGIQTGRYPVLTNEDVYICRAAFDFLDRALDLDPFTRFTAGELLEHPFLNVHASIQ